MRILGAASASTRTVRGLTGPERHALYLMACATGFRAGELAALTPESFSVDAEPPTVSLPARQGKNRKTSVQPLRRDVADELRAFLTGRAKGNPVWPAGWESRAAEMLREDLEFAGVPYSVEGVDGPLFADFHAMRHTFISMLGKSGVTIMEAQLLARHSNPKLTIGRYSHATLGELAQTVEKMPDLGEATTLPFPGREKACDALAAVGLILWQSLLGGTIVRGTDALNSEKPRRRSCG